MKGSFISQEVKRDRPCVHMRVFTCTSCKINLHYTSIYVIFLCIGTKMDHNPLFLGEPEKCIIENCSCVEGSDVHPSAFRILKCPYIDINFINTCISPRYKERYPINRL